jgi:hypothetical protein
LASKKAEDGESETLTETATSTAMNVYALPTPPNSVLISYAPEAHRSPHAQSLLETPTKVPKSTNDVQLELHTSDASGQAVNDTNEGTKSMVKFGTGELASTRQAFDFNYIPQTPGSQSSFDAESMPSFAAKCIPKEPISKFINFKLPAGTAANPRGFPSSNRAVHQDNPNADAESARMNSISETNWKTPSTWKLASTESFSHSPLPGVGGDGSKSAQQAELPSAPRPLGNQHVSSQDRTILRTRSTEKPVNSVFPQAALNQMPLPMFELASFSWSQGSLSSPETSDEAPLADSAFVLDSSSGTEKRTKLNSNPTALSPDKQTFVDSVVNPSVLKFGSNSKNLTKDFNLKEWLDSPVEPRRSEICDGLAPSSEQIPKIEIRHEEDGEKENEICASLRSNDKVKQQSIERCAIEKLAASSRENPTKNNDGENPSLDLYQTPNKISCRQFEGLMTPEDTPEPLGADSRSGPEAVEASSSRPVKKPVDVHDYDIFGLPTPESTPQPLARPGNLSANEALSFSPPERAESFGHVQIDSTDWSYKTRLPESKWQTMVHSAKVTQIFDDEDAFDGVNIKPFTYSEGLVREHINRENFGASPKRGEGRRWMQELPQHVNEAYESAFEAVRRRFNMLSKLSCCGTEEGQ